MNYRWIPKQELYKIKVNKKGNNNNLYTNINKKIRIKSNSNSVEKLRKNDLHIKCIEEENVFQNEGNILDDLINNKYLKPILESQNIDEKLYNCNLKEPVKNNFNVSLNDFFNRRKKYFINFKTPKPSMNNQMRGLSIKTLNISGNNSYYKNNLSNSGIHNKTLANSNINNYYNDIQMTNNYYNNYNNNEINILNPPLYNNNIKINNLCSSSIGRKIKKYFYNNNSNERNNFNNNKMTSPNLHFFKSQTYSEKEKNYSENYLKYKNNRIIRNKEINAINLTNENLDNEINNNNYNNNINQKYNDIKNIIKYNNKYDYNKKLFNIYRGKLINEFFKHIKLGINKYLSNIFRFFIEQIKFNTKNHLNKIDEIFIPKIHLEKYNKGNTRSEVNFVPYLQIFNSDKKNYQRYTNNNLKITEYKKFKNKNNINNSAIISQRKIFGKNNNIIKSNRNSMTSSITKNNIQIVKMKTNNNNSLIYKKKKLNNNNNMFIKKNKNNLSNSKGKIIDIDINLGKPIRDISDINPLESGFFINKNNINTRFKSSLSTNKREKRKIKNKSKNKKLSLPRKKYLEEQDDDFFSEIEDNINNKDDNSFEKDINNDNFIIKTNNNIIQPLLYKSSRITSHKNKYDRKNSKNKEKIISMRNISTSDKRLFININYVTNSLYENKSKEKQKYNDNSLIIKRNIYFPIFGKNLLKSKTLSNNIYLSSRNNNNLFEDKNKRMNMTNYLSNDKDKYLNSCVKFIIKNINKIFLKKYFKYFLNEYNNKFKQNKKYEANQGNKYKINTYKKKIGKNAINN